MVRPPGRDLRRHQFESTSAVNFACNPRRAGCAPTRRRVIAVTHRHGVRAGVGTCPRPRNSLTVTDFGGVDIGIHQAMRRSQVMQLTIAITVWLRRSAGHRQPWIFPRRRRLPGREFPQQRPRTAVQPASFEGTVQVLAMHQAVEHVAGAVTAGVAVRDRPSVALTAQVQDVLQDDPREVSTRPLPERTQPLCETPAVGGVIRFPIPSVRPEIALADHADCLQGSWDVLSRPWSDPTGGRSKRSIGGGPNDART